MAAAPVGVGLFSADLVQDMLLDIDDAKRKWKPTQKLKLINLMPTLKKLYTNGFLKELSDRKILVDPQGTLYLVSSTLTNEGISRDKHEAYLQQFCHEIKNQVLGVHTDLAAVTEDQRQMSSWAKKFISENNLMQDYLSEIANVGRTQERELMFPMGELCKVTLL